MRNVLYGFTSRWKLNKLLKLSRARHGLQLVINIASMIKQNINNIRVKLIKKYFSQQ